MRNRCADQTNTNYGGRGITVSPLWDDFQVFLKDIGDAPSASHSLDRIDVDGNYEPGNVQWATAKEQARNRRSTRMLSFQGETLPWVAWAE